MGKYYIKVKGFSLIIYFSDKLATSNDYISMSKKGDFLGLVHIYTVICVYLHSHNFRV